MQHLIYSEIRHDRDSCADPLKSHEMGAMHSKDFCVKKGSKIKMLETSLLKYKPQSWCNEWFPRFKPQPKPLSPESGLSPTGKDALCEWWAGVECWELSMWGSCLAPAGFFVGTTWRRISG
jgi:hypothetical protein